MAHEPGLSHTDTGTTNRVHTERPREAGRQAGNKDANLGITSIVKREHSKVWI